MNTRFPFMLSALVFWVLTLLYVWILYDQIDAEGDLDRLKANADFTLAAGAIGLIAGLIGGLILLASRMTLIRNMGKNAIAWLGIAVAIYFLVYGARNFTLYDGEDSTEQKFYLPSPLINFILAVIFFLAALFVRGEEGSDRGIFTFFHVLAVLALCVAWFLFFWEDYSTNYVCRIEDNKSGCGTSDDRKAWYSIIMITSFGAAGVGLLAFIVNGLKDGVMTATFASAAVVGSYAAVVLSVADGECEDDCPKDSLLSIGIIGSIASAVLLILFCLRSNPTSA